MNLEEAVKKYDIERVKEILDEELSGYNSGDESYLMLAAKDGQTALVNLLLLNDEDPNHQDEYGCTALMLASMYGYPEIVHLLLNRGAKPNIKDYEGNTALSLALEANQQETAAILSRRGATQ
jgi:ankyrin repeat protein